MGVGEDFEYRTSPDSFLTVCCDAVRRRLPGPAARPLRARTIYPDNYHAFSFTEDNFGLVYKVRRRLEARRLLKAAGRLPANAAILDVGCGDGFHLDLLREFGPPGWQLEGVDLDPRAADAAEARGLLVHRGSIEELDLPAERYDFAILVQTIEHVADPAALLRAIRRVLRPGGRMLVVTDNTGSLDFADREAPALGRLPLPAALVPLRRAVAAKARRAHRTLEVEALDTMVSPVNWVYSIRNALDDWGAPRPVVEWLSLESPIPLAVFTVFDWFHQRAGRAALLRSVLRRDPDGG